MAIITFWSDGKIETGKTASMAAISTFLSIEHNYKILILNTKHNDKTLEDCFWDSSKDNKFDFKNKNKTDIGTGTGGLTKAILSNKTDPNTVTNYTKTIFKDRLELLTDKDDMEQDFETQRKFFKEIIKISNKYYDLVFVDLSGDIDDDITNGILEISNLIVVNLTQRIRQINEFMKIKQDKLIFNKDNILTLLGKCDSNSKYNAKNASRYIGERELLSIPYNTLFAEACNEGKVADLFIKFRKINPNDPNALLINSVKNASEKIVEKLKEEQMRI